MRRARYALALSILGCLPVLALACDQSGPGCEELDLDGCYATPGCQYIEERDVCAPPNGTGCFYDEEFGCPEGTTPEVVPGGDGRGGCDQALRCLEGVAGGAAN